MTDFDNIEVLARMTDTTIECRDICDKWLLLTYDLPLSEAGNKARRHFLSQAKMLGATKHTDSVYLMPWTAEAELMALELARVGDVTVWNSETTESSLAKYITKSYDKRLDSFINEVSDRIDRINWHLDHQHLKIADMMKIKTAQMLVNLEDAIKRRGSRWLWAKVVIARIRYEAIP